ncbi:hypothetical protein J6590_079808 [Homalodisca vitripennis]|nr:hypothetical protein J6590_079808 [Homalodisca vitripennis]
MVKNETNVKNIHQTSANLLAVACTIAKLDFAYTEMKFRAEFQAYTSVHSRDIPKHRAEARSQLRTRGLHTTVYNKGIKLAKTPRRSPPTVTDERGIKFAKPPRRSPPTVTDERVTYNCVQQGNKVGQTTTPEPAHSYGREGNKVGQTTAPEPAHSYGREGYIQLYNKGIKLAKPPRRSPLTVTDERVTYNCVQQGISWPNHRRSPLTVTDERVTYNCVQQGNKVGQNTAPKPAHSYGREGYIQLCTTRE